MNQKIVFFSLSLLKIIKGYLEKINDSNNHSQIPSIVLANLDILFGNIKEIYVFHSRTFLKELEIAIMSSISDICKLFVKCKSSFYFYSTYCLNKPHSEEIWREYCASCPFFKVKFSFL
jgi:guanine nucleotide exchange factor MCF2